MFKDGRSISCLICQFHTIITLTLCVSWQFYYKGFAPIQTFSFAFDLCGFSPPTPLCLYLPSWNGMKDFQKYIQENIFTAVNYREKKILVKQCFKKKKKKNQPPPHPPGKAEQQSRCTGEKHICWFCTMEWKSTSFYYHFKPLTNSNVEGKKK